MEFFQNKKNLAIIGGIAFLAIILIFKSKKNDDISDISKMTTAPVLTTKVLIAPVVHFIPSIGELKANKQVSLKAEVDGKISTINFQDGSDVKKGDVLIEFDSNKAQAALKEAEAMHAKALSEFEPASQLANKGMGTALQSKVKKAEVDVCAARVDQQKDYLSKHKIIAPFDGKTSLVEVNEGEFIMSNQNKELVKLVNYHPLKVDFTVPESHYQDVYIAQKIQLLITDCSGREVEYEAVVKAIDPFSEKTSRSFKVRAIVTDDINHTLKPGVFVKLKVPIRTTNEGILIPESALETTGEAEYTYTVVNDTARRVAVVSGVKKEGNVEIISGLKAGDIVITHGHNRVTDGGPVKVMKNETMFQFQSMGLIDETQPKTTTKSPSTKIEPTDDELDD